MSVSMKVPLTLSNIPKNIAKILPETTSSYIFGYRNVIFFVHTNETAISIDFFSIPSPLKGEEIYCCATKVTKRCNNRFLLPGRYRCALLVRIQQKQGSLFNNIVANSNKINLTLILLSLEMNGQQYPSNIESIFRKYLRDIFAKICIVMNLQYRRG